MDTTSCVHYGFHSKDDRHYLFDSVFANKVRDHLPLDNKWKETPGLNFKDLLIPHGLFTI